MKRAGAALVASAVALGSVMFIVLFTLDDDTPKCGPTTASPGTSNLPPGSKSMPMAAGTYQLTSGFGPRGDKYHYGQDFGSTAGQPIYAAADGTVAASGPATGFGDWIVIDSQADGKPFSTVYGHMFEQDLMVHAGDTVRAGQQIAKVGYNGEVDPAGPGGAHLHFEVWQDGTRQGGGKAIDPMGWLTGASEPGTGAGAETPTPSASPATPVPTTPTAPAAPGTSTPGGADLAAATGVLPPLPASKGSEEHLQIDTVRLVRSIASAFPEIQSIGGWRESDPYPDHPSGRAADLMIPNYNSGDGKMLGDKVADYVLAHAEDFHVEYIIWRQTYRTPAGDSKVLEDRGGDTANHMDHVHVSVSGGGYPDGSTPITGAPGVTANPTSPGGGCGGPKVDAGLNEGEVPAEFVPWLKRAGSICPQITAPMLAAQIMAESGFQQHGYNGAGASGYTQFIDSTWRSYGFPVDDNGNPTGPAGSGDRNKIGDAVMAQGHYMCDIARDVDAGIASGKVNAPNGPEELYFAAYNAGTGAVLSSGGFPTGSPDYETETRPYCQKILAMWRGTYSKTLT
ncbi:peptidoglycan DD-metalloendopeptidase family protein [Nocardia sp. NPDC004582]